MICTRCFSSSTRAFSVHYGGSIASLPKAIERLHPCRRDARLRGTSFPAFVVHRRPACPATDTAKVRADPKIPADLCVNLDIYVKYYILVSCCLCRPSILMG